MIDVSQNQITRKWGFRVVEGVTGSMEASNMEISRIICEDFSCNSPQEVFAYIDAIRKSLDTGKVKVFKEGIVWGYQIYDSNSQNILFEEGGWLDQGSLQDHVTSIKKSIQGDIKMASIPRATRISIGDSGNRQELRSTYTDPVTGKTYDSGSQSPSLDMNRIRQEAALDANAEVADNKKLLGE
jgi:hypothetical protein